MNPLNTKLKGFIGGKSPFILNILNGVNKKKAQDSYSSGKFAEKQTSITMAKLFFQYTNCTNYSIGLAQNFPCPPGIIKAS